MKRIIKFIVIGICLGFILFIIQKIFQIDEATLMHHYWIAASVVVIGTVLINVCYNLFYFSKTKKAIELLNQEKPQEYIQTIDALLKTAKGKVLRNILTLNLAAGYIETKQFDIAIPMLEELSTKRLKGSAVNLVHRINLCQSYFETKQYEKAIAIYNENKALFQKYRNDKNYGGHIAILDVIAAIIHKQYDQAEKLLNMAKETYDDSRLQKAFHEISHILNDTSCGVQNTESVE